MSVIRNSGVSALRGLNMLKSMEYNPDIQNCPLYHR